MQNKNFDESKKIGAMHKRRVMIEDGRRYLIYYEFGTTKNEDEKNLTDGAKQYSTGEENENV